MATTKVIGLADYEPQREHVGLMRALGVSEDFGRQIVELRLEQAAAEPVRVALELVAFGLVLRRVWFCVVFEQ